MRRRCSVLERAGASAIQIEDQVFPKRCGHFAGKEVIPAPEMVQKIKAAVDARHDPDFLIIARTNSRAVEGFDAAIARAAAYREAGADVLFVEAPTSEAELAAIPARLPGPQIANIVFGGKTPELPRERLAALGFAGIIYANAALQAAVAGMSRVLSICSDRRPRRRRGRPRLVHRAPGAGRLRRISGRWKALCLPRVQK